ncbi:hypothetical protein AB0M47_26270 [Hamadaea sp. NPDC051192]|uniref:hypothetical protein n=1 Tax=Hamadaea sp. NPDC051192 TaxID=3154940 RepID=UPI0034436E4D
MSNDFLAKPRRGGRAVLVGAALLTVLAIGGTIKLSTAKPDVPTGTAIDPGATTSPAAAASISAPPVVLGPVTLVRGSRVLNGVSVGYPHSTVGSVSAAAEYATQFGSTLEPDRAATVGRIIADPSFELAPDYFAKGPVNTRKALGMSASGDLPQGASVALNPVAYQIRDVSADKVVVLLLGYYTTSTPGQGIKSEVGVWPLEMHWADDDWKVLKPGVTKETDYNPLAARPGTADAIAKGWQELRR